jgi:hypothetical protein
VKYGVRIKIGHILRNLSGMAQKDDFAKWKNSPSYGQRQVTQDRVVIYRECLTE